MLDVGNSTVTDASGNVYVAGSFRGTVDFDPGTGVATLVSAGLEDAFVAKYTSSGVYIWAFRMGSTQDDRAYSITVDASGDIYVTGAFKVTVDFDPGPGVASLTSAGDFDIYCGRYTPAGAYVWAFRVGAADADYGYCVAAKGSSLYLTGSFSSTVDFDPGPGVANITSSAWDIYLASYTTGGTYQWAFPLGGSSNDDGYSIAIDTANNLYVTGYFQSVADFDPGGGVANLVSNGGLDVFLASYTSAGAYRWAFNIGSTSNDWGYGAASQGANVSITGYFQGTLVDFDPSVLGTAYVSSVGGQDIFVGDYTVSSGAYQWAFGVGSSGNDVGKAISLDGGHVYTTGSFTGTADFDPGSGSANLTSAGGRDIYIAKYDIAGLYECAGRMGGTGNDDGNSIVAAGGGYFYVTGSFSGTSDFDPGTGVANLVSSGNVDMFLGKYSECVGLLPLELLSLTGQNAGAVNILSWSACAAKDYDHFDVERSPDGIDFSYVGSVQALGSSLQEVSYTFVDETPFAFSYYRLKVIRMDGDHEYSNVVTLGMTPMEALGLRILGNPSTGRFRMVITIADDTHEDLTIDVFDMSGRIVFRENLGSPQPASFETELDLCTHPNGTYLVALTSDSECAVRTPAVVIR